MKIKDETNSNDESIKNKIIINEVKRPQNKNKINCFGLFEIFRCKSKQPFIKVMIIA